MHDAIRDAASCGLVSFVDAPAVVDRSLSLIVEHSKSDESARPESLSTHSANREQRQLWTSKHCV